MRRAAIDWPTARDHAHNLNNLASMVEIDTAQINQSMEGRVGFRTTTPDYFPIVGPVPDVQALLERFATLRHKANTDITACSPTIPGLFTLLGLGSRGIAYAPLVAELLASLVCSEALPVDQQLYPYLHPSRFLIRNLSRNKIVPLSLASI